MGYIIVIEGCDGCGKETQSKLLVESLQQQGVRAVEFSFPMYDSPTGKIFKNCILGKNDFEMIKEYLLQDYIVVLNRYTSSNMANQGSRYEDSEERFYMYQWIDKLEYWLLKLPKPDMTILLNLPNVYSSCLKEKQLSFEMEKNNQDNILSAYLELAELYHWDVINCIENDHLRSIEEIHNEIVKLVAKKYLHH